MELTPHVESLRASLQSIAGDDEAAVAMAERLSSALDAALHLQLLDLLSQIALELNEQLPNGRVEVRLAGRDAQLVYVRRRRTMTRQPTRPTAPPHDSPFECPKDSRSRSKRPPINKVFRPTHGW